jgi:hypothetical protein
VEVQTIAGTEASTCKLGWYFQGWGKSTAWPHFITIANTNSAEAEGSSIQRPYSVRLSDNWNGDVTQTTRFGIPQDDIQFRKMHKDFRSPERLITTTLRPAISASLDSVANLFSMEEYYAGGQRDQFKTEFRDAVIKGRAKVTQHVNYTQGNVDTIGGQASSDNEAAQDTSSVGTIASRNVTMKKVLDENGNVIREEHNYVSYGITVAIALLENLDPDDKFEKQIQARKDAASRRIVAQEERREQEEQRLLAIQTGETDIAKKQAAARVVQIEQTTNAETTKKLALIKASRMLEEAEIAKQTSAINLEKARIDADAKVVAADAAAYEKAQLLAADNALQIKVDAIVQMNKDAMSAFAKRNVPQNVIYTGGAADGSSLGANDEIANIAATQMLKNLRALDLDLQIKQDAKQ